ncbi:hypothetical protein M426DRAFT_260739 [Hypoxylon sp. CI-4A]|nr:hypothetical protein M426DRAFT_260739 [Hypoxylon sp. CI-4A]
MYEYPTNYEMPYSMAMRVLIKLFRMIETSTYEYIPSLYWQSQFQYEFPLEKGYAVGCEQPPEPTSRNRMDGIVLRYDDPHDTLSVLILREDKKRKGNYKVVESQALEGAVRAMNEASLDKIYCVTTVGGNFRAWVVESPDARLQPLFGPDTQADRNSYQPGLLYDVDPNQAAHVHRWRVNPELTRVIDLIKYQFPLRQAPILPSQQLDQGTMGSHYPDVPVNSSSWARTHEQPADQADMMDMEYHREPTEGISMTAHAEPSEGSNLPEASSSSLTTPGPSGTQHDSITTVKVVKVKKIPHRLHPDEYEFTDVRGKQRTTRLDEWDLRQIAGRSVRVYVGRKMEYWCYQFPE